jgi:hypothetical protein
MEIIVDIITGGGILFCCIRMIKELKQIVKTEKEQEDRKE